MEKPPPERSGRIEVGTEISKDTEKFKSLTRRLLNLSPEDVKFVKNNKTKSEIEN